MIEQGTKYPPTVKKTGHYTTTEDNQTAISFDVYEGNQLSNAKDPENKKIYHFRISGLKPMPARKAKVDVTFTLNEEGMLYIHAEDLDGVAPSYDNRDNPVNWNVERKQNKK
ncbi:Hsp70 family protein [Erysipelatoclostridium sp. An173]|uniref:Hsp70 family protein n=1 Tax=Erysipelatoclostridium sp. An173 TaxID=1965571 RepID=UPI0031BA6E1E